MRIATVVLLSFSVTAHAAKFRVLDFGDICTAVPELEAAPGSISIPWKQPDGEDLYAFKGRAFDREVSIVYHCVKGSLYGGSYFFPLEPLDEAVESYKSIYGLR